jgi:demethylmenaquinone methyltransferase/2-methoxy-6-polyprenyl-1,4-benzoquinol methylase
MLRLASAGTEAAITWCRSDAHRLPFADASFSIVSCAFGIRNFQRLDVGLREMRRVLRPGGRAVILEFSMPRGPILRRLYKLYMLRIMPIAATLVSRDRTGAYRYLPRSVLSFADEGEILASLCRAGFASVEPHRLTGGIVTAYVAEVGP